MSQLINESDELTQRAPEIAEGRRRSTEPLITKSERVRVDQVNWWALGWLGVAHIGALFAPWTFTWQALIVTVLFHWICGSLGICLGYHRMLTHTGFRTYRPIRYMFAVFGSMAGEGSPLDWVSDHRKHHAHSDLPGEVTVNAMHEALKSLSLLIVIL